MEGVRHPLADPGLIRCLDLVVHDGARNGTAATTTALPGPLPKTPHAGTPVLVAMNQTGRRLTGALDPGRRNAIKTAFKVYAIGAKKEMRHLRLGIQHHARLIQGEDAFNSSVEL